MLRIDDHFDVFQCNYCLHFGHTTKYCPNKTSDKPERCKKCGDEHRSTDCELQT